MFTATLKKRQARDLPARSFLLEPFDIGMHTTPQGLVSLQTRFTQWLRALTGPARFGCWVRPATLHDKVGQLSQVARDLSSVSPLRAELAMEYRRFYERLDADAEYQRAVCGLTVWSDDRSQAQSRSIAGAFETHTQEAAWPSLFDGHYHVQNAPFGHVAPVGRPGGRLLWAVLSSYEFLPAEWNFFKPAKSVLSLSFPLALIVDIPYTYDRVEGIDAIETNLVAYKSHLATLRGGEDSRAVQRVVDCQRALQDLNAGDALHRVQVFVAVAAPDIHTLRERIGVITARLRPYILLRQEHGELLERAVAVFGPNPSSELGLPDTSWALASRELALLFAPLGYRKLSNTAGVMRGEAVEGGYPVFLDAWRDKRATHELWIGATGYGKSFALNCYLLREYAEQGIPFDMLEPMGHGRKLANAIGIEAYSLNPRRTRLNPQDVVYPSAIEQVNHVLRLYEAILGRTLKGGQRENLERGLLAQAIELLYSGFPDLLALPTDQTPTCADVCAVLAGLGETERQQKLAFDLAEELRGLVCGRGPWASFLNGATNIDLGTAQNTGPRVFMFNEMSEDTTLLALAYTQVLSALRRDALKDEQPRIIAVDEVYRLAKYPALVDFLIDAVKTFRTRRKKVIAVDQNLMTFVGPLGDKTGLRYLFENTPIKVYLNQKEGVKVFYEDPAFDHLTPQHKDTIASLPRFHAVLDIAGEGIFCVLNRASDAELRRFQGS